MPRDAALDPRSMTPDWYARETRPEPEALSEALRPHLQQVFPPALLGRIEIGRAHV